MDASVIVQPCVQNDYTVARNPPRLQRAHLVGIAGSGMRAMAEVLGGWGWAVSGSDCCITSVACVERTSGTALESGPWCVSRTLPGKPAETPARLFEGHAAENVPADANIVIYSDAVPKDNPELRRAAELGTATLSYFEMLGRLSAGRHTVAVAGTHGKSSTTAMLAHILTRAGFDPTVFCGAAPLGKTSGGRAGRSQLMIVEACEYRRNFLHLTPRHAAILGVEADHFDCYDSLEEIEDEFGQFAKSVAADGLLLARHDCPSAQRAAHAARCRLATFALCADADWSAGDLKLRPGPVGGQFQFELRHCGRALCSIALQVPGRHNVLNALAAAALAWENGATAEQIAAGLGHFAGLHRRLEVLGSAVQLPNQPHEQPPHQQHEQHEQLPPRQRRGVTHVDDYAHHPTEIRAALATVRQMYPGRRLWCVFQPHQVSRTARLLDELAASLQNADKVFVTEIFRAREGSPQPGEVTAADLARRTRELGGTVLPGHTAGEIVAALKTHLVPGDVLVTLGAGDVARYRP